MSDIPGICMRQAGDNMNNEENHYRVLGVDSNASRETITRAYRMQARLLHPDRNSDPNATEMFQVLQKAYQTLSNDTTRNEYNANIDSDGDENDDDVLFGAHSGHAELDMGKKWSEDFTQKIDAWINEYQYLNIHDNFREEMSTILNDTLEQFGDYFDNDGQINKYKTCETCQQRFLHIDKHQYQITLPYKKLFETTPSLSEHRKTALLAIERQLKECVKPNIWNWMPSTLSLEYAGLWSDPNWQSIETMIDQIKEPIEIVNSKSCLQGSHIYINEGSNSYQQHQSVAMNLATAKAYQYLSDPRIIGEIKMVLSDSSKQCMSDRSSNSADMNRLLSGTRVPLFNKTILSVRQQQLLSQHINIDDFYYTVQESSQSLSQNAQTNCNNCGTKFHIFRQRYTCQMCGAIQCSNCQLQESIPHLGYIQSVKVCKPCTLQKLVIMNQTICSCLRQAIQRGTSGYLNTYLALLQQYSDADLAPFYLQVGDQYFQLENYPLALQCYYYAKIEYKRLLSIIRMACIQQKYSLAFTCIEIIRKLYDEDGQLLLNNSLEYDTLSQRSDKDSYNYATMSLLFCAKERLNVKNMLSKSVFFNEAGNHDVCLFYLLYVKSKFNTSVNWKQLGDDFLKKSKFQLATFCFHAAQLPIDSWIHYLDLLSTQCQYSTAALTLTLINPILDGNLGDMEKKATPVVSFLNKVLLSSHEELTHWINHAVSLMKQKTDNLRIIWCVAFIQAQFNNNWKKLKEDYYSCLQREPVLLCYKMEQMVDKNQNSLLTFPGDIYSTNTSLAIELLSVLNIEWKVLGDHYLQEKSYEQALNCYLNSKADNINYHILAQASKCTEIDFNLLFNVAVYSRTKSDENLLLTFTGRFCQLLPLSNETRKSLLIETIKLNQQLSAANNQLFKFHLLLLTELAKDERANNYAALMAGGLHFISRYDNLTSDSTLKLVELNRKFLAHMNATIYNQIKASTYLSIQEFAKTVENINEITILKLLLNDCVGRQKITDLTPLRYRSMMYIIEAEIYKLENNIPQSLNRLHEALLCCPVDDVMEAIVYLLEQVHFHETIVQTLVDHVRSIKEHFDQTGSVDIVNSIMIDIQLPDMKHHGNGLKKTPQLNVIRKYERAVIKQMMNAPLSAALSYIDLSMATKDLTCLISNFLLAGLYFYELLKKTTDNAKAYAYRNVIIDLTLQTFTLSRHYLALHMQVYMFKIAFTLIVKSTLIFQTLMNSTGPLRECRNRTAPMLNKQHQRILSELLKNIIQLTRMAPLAQLPLARSYDVLYMEVVGQELLAKFLISSAAGAGFTLYPTPLYQYYVFEGVWRGWIRNETFDATRFNCMQSLLARKGWNMLDVQHLLQWSYLQRTPDGWLPSTTCALNLEHQSAFAKVNGISFNINTGEIKFLFRVAQSDEHSLFDRNDVFEVLSKGITSSLFTLDQPEVDYQSHPFQEMRYLPAKLLKTNFLSTLLHTDYLLKMISTGAEICSEPPFEMRSASDGFMKRLPEWLREELKPIHERKDSTNVNRVHRFWIEAGAVTYEHHFDENNNVITYYLDDVPMCVKKQLMQYDEQGNLIDDLSNPDDDQSPEGEFAKAFTRHYNHIGSHFPELLRLKELLKLGVLLLFIRSTFENIQKYINNIRMDTEPINDYLQQIGNQVTYPRATDYEINRITNELLKDQNISYSAVPYSQRSELRAKIQSQLIEADETNLNKIVEAIREACHRPHDTGIIRKLVVNWLRCNNRMELIDFIGRSLETYKRETYSKILETIIFMGVNLDKNEQFQLQNSATECSWVPAAFCSKKSSGFKIYGGVSLQIDLKEGRVQRTDRQVQAINAHSFMKSVCELRPMTFTSAAGDGSRRNLSNGSANNYQSSSNNGSYSGNPTPPPSTGRTEPRDLNEQLAMEEAKASPQQGRTLPNIRMNDQRWPDSEGWVKMEHVHRCLNGSNITIHYVQNTNNRDVADFKFIDHLREN